MIFNKLVTYREKRYVSNLEKEGALICGYFLNGIYYGSFKGINGK